MTPERTPRLAATHKLAPPQLWYGSANILSRTLRAAGESAAEKVPTSYDLVPRPAGLQYGPLHRRRIHFMPGSGLRILLPSSQMSSCIWSPQQMDAMVMRSVAVMSVIPRS